jgi:O-antigen/teichoic acid export membrane protein
MSGGEDMSAPRKGVEVTEPPAHGLTKLGKHAGRALLWQAAEHGSDKVISLARLLILAAILTPDDFGLLAASLVALTIFTAVTELGMSQALIQRPSAEAVHYDTAWTFGVGRGLVVAGLVFVTAPWFAEFLNEPRAVPIISVLGLGPLLQSLQSIRVLDHMRNLRFGPLAILRVTSSLASALTAILLAPSFGVWALVAGVLVGPAIFSLFSYVIAPYRPRLRFDWLAGRALLSFGLWIFLSHLISTAASAVLTAMISRRLGSADLGLYFLAFKMTFSLIEVGQQVINNVAFPLYSRLQHDPKDVSRVFRSILVGVTVLLVPPFAILIVLAPALPDVLGVQWAGAILIVQIFCLAHIVGLFGDTVVPLLQGLGRPNQVTVLEAVQSAVMISAVFALTGLFGLVGAVSSWIVAFASSFVLSLIFVYRLVERPFEGIAGLLAAIAGVTAGGGLLGHLLYAMMPSATGAIIAGLLSVVAAWGGIWLIDKILGLGLPGCLAVVFPILAQSQDKGPNQ